MPRADRKTDVSPRPPPSGSPAALCAVCGTQGPPGASAPSLPSPPQPDDQDLSAWAGVSSTGSTARLADDRSAAMEEFTGPLIQTVDRHARGGRVSDQAWQNSFYVAVSASARAALRCVTACLEDFRGDLATISIPVLVIHGDQDRVLPYEATSQRLPALMKNARSTIIAGGPHAIIWTHADEVSQALLDFIGHLSRAGTA